MGQTLLGQLIKVLRNKNKKMNKKILISLSVIGVVAAIGIGGTVAYFSDTETSTGNTFTAGTLDLKVDDKDDPDVVRIAFSDLKPCDGVGDTEHLTISYQWTLANAGSISGQPWIEIANLVDYDNGCSEPEGDVDNTCGDAGAGEGELSQYLMMQVNAAGSGGFEYPHGPSCTDGGRNCPLGYWASLGPVGQSTWEVIGPHLSIAPLVLEFELPCDVGNVVQSDSVEFDIIFHLDQVE